MNKYISNFILILTLCFALLIGVGTFTSQPAAALVEKEYEAPGKILYKSRHSLRDRSGNAWQVIFFKRYTNNELNTISLRLVGFPGMVEVIHPQPLKLSTANNKFIAEDMFSQKSPAPNVGQYDLKNILSELPTNKALRLLIPSKRNGYPLRVPPSLVMEWQILSNK